MVDRRNETCCPDLEKTYYLKMLRTLLSRVLWFCVVFCIAARADEPVVRMLVPGFTVQELPLELSNINNLRFALNGTLTALGYDGRVHLLRDTNGDGLEDSSELFWDKTTITVPVGMAWSTNGLYVSSHGKVSLLRDTDGDGKAEVEEIIASGWPPTDVGSGGVDATSVTLDQDGNIYFGLMAADYSNPYRVKDGVSRYDLNSPRGTIQKWNVKTKQLETIATGIRVPYTLAVNRAGDLFLTDQEGETWCPGGNPLDELNHIIPGRNYGFPPRHESYLPDLVSEPPVVGFGPQHQSACGFVFNEAGASRKSFGPVWWEGDALVAGESRGKIWRVQLVKTPSGYIGRESLITRLDMLTTDVAISPTGDLYVSCHSGDPDWGTGPNGMGKLFKISHTDTNAPQPVAIWPSGPMEVRVGFDRPIDPDATNHLDQTQIEFGPYVSSADRLEVLKPPYQTVKHQETTSRGKLRVVAASLSPDHRTMAFTTDPHPQSVHYALTLPRIKADGSKSPAATIDLAYDLSGVEANWFAQGDSSTARWSGWLPCLDWQVNAAFTAHSAEHARLLPLLHDKGHLQLRARLALPAGRKTLSVESSAPFEMRFAAKTTVAQATAAGQYAAEINHNFTDQPELLTIRLETGSSKPPSLHVSYFLETDPTPRPLPFDALVLPWAPPRQPPIALPTEKTELTGGDYERGRSLFFGERLKCATCHRVRTEGSTVGPDLSNLVHRDAASVLRDIKDPTATLHPDYVAYNVWLRDGSNITGFVRAQTGNVLCVVGSDGKEQVVQRLDVTDLRPSTVSLMPTGLLEGLKESQVRDLLTFLLHGPPSRTRADVTAVLRQTAQESTIPPSPMKPLNIVLVASKQDHGTGQHDYPAWQKSWTTLLGQAPGVTATSAWEWPAAEQWRAADVIVFYFWNHDWSAERYRQLDDYQARGGGVAIFHAATIADKEPEKLANRIGLAAQPGPTKYLHAPTVLEFIAPTNHAITRGFKRLNLLDEPYWPMFGDTNRIEVLASADIEGKAHPLIWTYQTGKGRVFASIPGHYTWTFEDSLFRILALRGVAWAAGEPASRFDPLSNP